MTDLILINDLRESELRAMLLTAVISPEPVQAMSRLIASVDWSGLDPDAELNSVEQMLGEASGLAEEAGEGDITAGQFVRQIRQLAENMTIPGAASSSSFGTILSGEIVIGNLPAMTPTERVLVFA